jgi:hypothetical protein
MNLSNSFRSAFFAFAGVSASLLMPLLGHAAPSQQYDSGNPSAEEQYMLELINFARANPRDEGQRLASCTDSNVLTYYKYYKVNTGALAGQFSGYAAKPPVAMNRMLSSSARRHSLDMAARGVQAHVGGDGSTFDGRMVAAGYSDYSSLGENIYAYIYNAYFGHVGLNADWGVPALDHRANIMNYGSYTFKEVGISIVPTNIKNFGPNVVTQDFGTPRDANRAFLLGVVYADRNGNGQYDPGEGLNGVQVSPSTGDYYAVTGAAGGYTIPLPTNGSGSLTLTISGGELGETQTTTVTYTVGQNVKVDFVQGTAPAGSAKAAQGALSLLSDGVPISGGWNYSPTLGYWNSSYLPTLYHETLGFMYYIDAKDGNGGAYLYDFVTNKWRYTSPTLYPYLYDFSAGAFVYYFKGTASPRSFVNMSTNQFFFE